MAFLQKIIDLQTELGTAKSALNHVYYDKGYVFSQEQLEELVEIHNNLENAIETIEDLIAEKGNELFQEEK